MHIVCFVCGFIYYFNCISFAIRLSGRKFAIKLIDWLITFSTLSHTMMFFEPDVKLWWLLLEYRYLPKVPVHSGRYTRVKFTKRKTKMHHTTTAFESGWSYKWSYCGRRCIKLTANLDDWKRWLNVERAKLDHAAVTSVSGVVVSWRASRPAVDIVNTLYDLDIALIIITFCCSWQVEQLRFNNFTCFLALYPIWRDAII